MQTQQVVAPAPIFTWTGVYPGANVGPWFAPANSSYEGIGFPSPAFDLVPNGGGQKAGVTGGFQAGYNYQIGSFVPGFETDFNHLGNCRGGTFPAPSAYAPFGIGSYSLFGGCSYYYGSLRARLGYAFDRVLLYGTAGIAYGGNRNPGSVNLNPPAPGNYFTASWSHSARTKYVFGAAIIGSPGQNINMSIWAGSISFLPMAQDWPTHPANSIKITSFGWVWITGSTATHPPPKLHPRHRPRHRPRPPSNIARMVRSLGFPKAIRDSRRPIPADAFLGLGLWKGAGIYVNPEIDQGFAVGNTSGIAGFPNGFPGYA